MSSGGNVAIIVLTLVTVFSGISAEHSTEDGITGSDAPGNGTSPTTYVVRRRSPARVMSGGNRLSLMNSRFNRRPRKKNLDPEQLLEILGDFFDSNWMSIEKPRGISEEDQDVTYMIRKDAWPYKELTRALEATNLSKELTDMSGASVFDAKTMAVFKEWLMKKASCPVKYSWEDIGTMFWPRWVRLGECAAVPGTCSWPPGMHCVVTGRSNLHILRWQCKASKSKGRRRKHHKTSSKKDWNKRLDIDPLLLKCQWVRVPYPIISACHCTC